MASPKRSRARASAVPPYPTVVWASPHALDPEIFWADYLYARTLTRPARHAGREETEGKGWGRVQTVFICVTMWIIYGRRI